MEFDKEEIKYRSALYKKKSKLREEVLKCDWRKDGFMLLGGKRVDYITSEKIVRNFAPLLTQVGLEIECGFKDPVRLDPFGSRAEEHWLATFYVQYIDVDTGYATKENTYQGEGMDQRDKALKKANTDAQKLWLLADFKIGEGIDPDAGTNDTTGAYIPKDEQEQVEIKTRIATGAVKPKTPAPAPKSKVEEPKEEPEAPAEESKEEPAPAEEPKAAPAPPVPKRPVVPKSKAAEPKGTTVTDTVAPGANTEYGKSISEAQKKPLIGLFSKWSAARDSGAITGERFDEVKSVYENIGSNRDIIKFLAEYREIR